MYIFKIYVKLLFIKSESGGGELPKSDFKP